MQCAPVTERMLGIRRPIPRRPEPVEHEPEHPPLRRFVRLGDGSRVSLKGYVNAWSAALRAPQLATFKGAPSDPKGWKGRYTREEVLREFRGALDERINRALPWDRLTRKWSPQWQADMARAARDLNTPRLRFYWLPKDLRPRFEGRIARGDD